MNKSALIAAIGILFLTNCGGDTTPVRRAYPTTGTGGKGTKLDTAAATGGRTSSTDSVAGSGGSSSAGTDSDPGISVPVDAVPSLGCGKIRTLKDGTQSMTSRGVARTYYLKTPSQYSDTRPYRLIFMFHWYYGSINAIVRPPDADHNTDQPYYGLAELAGESSIFVVPQGLADSGGAGWANPNDRDVYYTDDMLTAISSDLCVDTSRVFATGFSYGGAISYKLACVRSDKFRGALVYDTGPVSGNNPAECTHPVAFFQSHGMDDQTFKYQDTALPLLNIFVKANGCSAMTPPDPPQDGHACVSFEGCTLGYPVRFCNFGSGENNPYNASLKGHYPSAKDPGQATSWVPAEAWDFIRQF